MSIISFFPTLGDLYTSGAIEVGNNLLTRKEHRAAISGEQLLPNDLAAAVSPYASPIPHLPKVLLGWELGSGMGHVRPLQQIAQRLAAAGFLPIFVLKQPELLHAENKWPVLQAPVGRDCAPLGFVAATFADVLAVRGYHSADALLPLVNDWRAILNRVQPSVVIADFAPTLCLAARGRFPVVTIGSGFSLPPSQDGFFPRISERGRPLILQEQILQNIQQVQQELGHQPLKTLSELLHSDQRFVTSLPELDPYNSIRPERVHGPLEFIPAPTGSAPKRFFAYLGMEMPDCRAVLTALVNCGYSGKAFVRNADPALKQHMRKLGLKMLDAPMPADKLVAEHGVIVHFGGAGTAHLALAAGRPQLLFPIHLEHFITGRKLHALGVAHVLSGTFLSTHVTEAMRQLMNDTGFGSRALSRADAIQSRGPWNAQEKIIAGCQRLARR